MKAARCVAMAAVTTRSLPDLENVHGSQSSWRSRLRTHLVALPERIGWPRLVTCNAPDSSFECRPPSSDHQSWAGGLHKWYFFYRWKRELRRGWSRHRLLLLPRLRASETVCKTSMGGPAARRGAEGSNTWCRDLAWCRYALAGHRVVCSRLLLDIYG